jgi:dihydrofolate reductase
MKKIIIAAVSINNVIGKENGIPWEINEEIKYFKKNTLNSAVLMGMKTFNSIGKPLSNRINLVLTNNIENIEKSDKLNCFSSLSDVLNFVDKLEVEKLFVIGGSEIYSQLMNDVDELWISRIPIIVDGDKYFPIINDDFWELKEKIHYESFLVEKYVRINQ